MAIDWSVVKTKLEELENNVEKKDPSWFVTKQKELFQYIINNADLQIDNTQTTCVDGSALTGTATGGLT